jgi:hypothetical protein
VWSKISKEITTISAITSTLTILGAALLFFTKGIWAYYDIKNKIDKTATAEQIEEALNELQQTIITETNENRQATELLVNSISDNALSQSAKQTILRHSQTKNIKKIHLTQNIKLVNPSSGNLLEPKERNLNDPDFGKQLITTISQKNTVDTFLLPYPYFMPKD